MGSNYTNNQISLVSWLGCMSLSRLTIKSDTGSGYISSNHKGNARNPQTNQESNEFEDTYEQFATNIMTHQVIHSS